MQFSVFEYFFLFPVIVSRSLQASKVKKILKINDFKCVLLLNYVMIIPSLWLFVNIVEL